MDRLFQALNQMIKLNQVKHFFILQCSEIFLWELLEVYHSVIRENKIYKVA